MNRIIKLLLPIWSIKLIKCILKSHLLLKEYLFWFWRDLWYSDTYRSEKTELSGLMINIHVLEKGITMPNRHLGFGYQIVRGIIQRCNNAIKDYSENHLEIQVALNGLEQYLQLHEESLYQLPSDISSGIEKLLKFKKLDTEKCFEMTKDELFKASPNFYEFAHQRRTVRWFTKEPINNDLLIKAIKLAQTAPSACNRQSTKCYIVDSKETKNKVLQLQNGNRGFGHLADKIILLTSDMRFWNFKTRTSAYLDTGIFTQNLLYSLHYYQIGACTLNAHLSIKQKKELQKIIGYSASEIPIVFIAIGNTPERFMVAGSQRLAVEQIYQFI